MDHGRYGPPGVLGGEAGAVNRIRISQGTQVTTPDHLSKGEGYVLTAGDWIDVKTPGGGGYGPPEKRPDSLRRHDHARGYAPAQADPQEDAS
jgi:N-methylhydantoinase B